MGKLFEAIGCTGNNIGIVFYDKVSGAELKRVEFPEEGRIGKLYRMELTDQLPQKDYLYQIYEDDQRRPDPKGRAFFAAKKYGEPKYAEDLYTIPENGSFDWLGTKNPKIPYNDCMIYCLHVRGFTKHASSGVKARGTFAGVQEKIPYLRKIGVTTLEFQPVYEFLERMVSRNPQGSVRGESRQLNYWGYTEGYYYAPKSDYASKNPVKEFKELVRELHANGMEAVLQFYFPKEFSPLEIPQILRFWVEEYHVDGFHLIGEDLPSELIARDPALSETKLWYYHMDTEMIYGKANKPSYVNLGLLRDDFYYDCRRFLKGDEGCVSSLMYHMRAVPEKVGLIHYLTTYWGFTLMDMVSYDFKHNEANGEENHDGTDYNCSWNCGEEGPSRKKKIRQLRYQQLKNALCLMFFAPSAPRIFMGDEFGNSQKGNNNPYCQDNDTTWLNWRNLETNKELFETFIELGSIRKKYTILHPVKEADMMDTISCSYPDLSFHGKTAWRPGMENSSRQLGVMYCGLYAQKTGHKAENKTGNKTGNPEPFLYLAMNMHWESHELGLPRLPKGSRWKVRFATCMEAQDPGEKQEVISLPPKSMVLLESREEKAEEKPGKNVENLITSAVIYPAGGGNHPVKRQCKGDESSGT